MYVVDQSEYLAHYGRKGMKWYQHIFGDKETQYARKEKSINRKVSRYEKKKAKKVKLSERQLKRVLEINRKLQKRTTGLGWLLYKADDPNTLALRNCLESAKRDRDSTLLEITRYEGLISKQYAKLDKAKIKYGKAAVDDILNKRR